MRPAPVTADNSQSDGERAYRDRYGNVTQMRTAAINRKPAEAPANWPSVCTFPCMSFYRVTICAHGRMREVSAICEREVALAAESILRQCDDVMPVGCAVDGPDPAARRRLTGYLNDVRLELLMAP
ncbi:hypothetical protein [Methylobacterium nigriterrae]|uniref:hypothetical protein n=1 Tax=Methylobacterium nigriterrae TaxID=3127512 RepID=UPI0030138376